jgi:hypothetical protein
MPKVMPQVKQTLRNLREAIKRGDKDKSPLIPTRPQLGHLGACF